MFWFFSGIWKMFHADPMMTSIHELLIFFFPLYPYFNLKTHSAFLQVPSNLCQVTEEILLIRFGHP